MDPIIPGSFREVFLTSWMPIILSVGGGGLLASTLIPLWQQRFQLSKQRTERKLHLAEETSKHFSRYIIAWRRLVTYSRALSDLAEQTPNEISRRDEFAVKRNDSRDLLYDSLSGCVLYFSINTCEKISAFIEWDESNSHKTLAELPAVDEWRKWKDCLLKSICLDIEKNA